MKKWFEEKDTCPYCRDKVLSERFLYRGDGTTAILREPSIDSRDLPMYMSITLAEERERLPPIRRTPPEDSNNDSTRRRTRVRHANIPRSIHTGRYQASQSFGRTHNYTRSRVVAANMQPQPLPSVNLEHSTRASNPSSSNPGRLPHPLEPSLVNTQHPFPNTHSAVTDSHARAYLHSQPPRDMVPDMADMANLAQMGGPDWAPYSAIYMSRRRGM